MSVKPGSKLIRILQIVSVLLIVFTVSFVVVFMLNHDITFSNAAALAEYIKGGTLAMAAIVVALCLVKSFALVLTPSIIFVISGLLFENFWVAVAVNCVASALSLVLTYYMGKLLGTNAVDKITKRYKLIKVIDKFTDDNSFAVIFILKAGGYIPSDVTSLIFGAMNIPFWKYFLASNLGLFVLNVPWTMVSSIGDMTNPLSYLMPLPATIIGIVALYILALRHRKKLLAEEKQCTAAEGIPEEKLNFGD